MKTITLSLFAALAGLIGLPSSSAGIDRNQGIKSELVKIDQHDVSNKRGDFVRFSYHEPSEVISILRQHHRLSRDLDSMARYHNILATVLIALREMTHAQQASIFNAVLIEVRNSGSFDGVESVFATGIHAMNLAGKYELVREGLDLWMQIGPPSTFGGGAAVALLADARTHSMLITNRLPKGRDLVPWLDKISLRASRWLSDRFNPWATSKNGRILAPIEVRLDASSHEHDSVEEFLNMIRQNGLRHFEMMMPDTPQGVGETIVAIISPVWLIPGGIAVGIAEIALPTLAEDAWHYIRTVGHLTLMQGGARGPGAFGVPERQTPGNDAGRRQTIVIDGGSEKNKFTSNASKQDRNGKSGAQRNGTANGVPNTADSRERGGGHHTSEPHQQTGEPEPNDEAGEPKGSNTSDASPTGKVSEGSGLRIESYAPGAYERGEPPTVVEELPIADSNGNRSRPDNDDLGPRGLKKSRWPAETMYRLVYGELNFTRHPTQKLFESETDNRDAMRLKVPGSNVGNSAKGKNDDLKNDLRRGMPESNSGEAFIRVQLPIPDDVRPMPPKS